MKIQNTLFVALSTIAISGCSVKSAYTPAAPVAFADANYSLAGKVSEEVCNAYIFGLDFSGLLQKTEANVPGGSVFGPAKEISEAMYAATKKIGDATHIVTPRTHVKASGLVFGPVVLFGQRCGNVEGHAATIKGPYSKPQ